MASTEFPSTTTPSTTSERAPMKQLSSMMVGLACSGSSTPPIDRKSVVSGKSVSVSVDLGGRRIIKKKNKITINIRDRMNQDNLISNHKDNKDKRYKRVM